MSKLISRLTTLLHQAKLRFIHATPKGPYNFLLKKIHKTMDVNLASKILRSDYFKEVLVPQPVDLQKLGKVVVFAPHADDESIGCAGLLSALSEKSTQIDLVFMTDSRPMVDDWEQQVAIRKREAQLVAEKLSASCTFIDINNVDLEVSQSHIDHIKELLWSGYDAIFSPWPLDSPPKHRLCNAILAKALKKVSFQDVPVFCYSVHSAVLPNVYFDYSDRVEEKKRLINIHQSQMVTQNYSHLILGLDAWNSRYLGWSAEERWIETFCHVPCSEWLKLVKMYEKHPCEAFRGDPKCIASYDHLHFLT
ncbi:PIG-L family deacetylase [Akkermansiaceae bacterium]|nr:PIG-L family deacetylase [Akkermansiaceae bacterium]